MFAQGKAPYFTGEIIEINEEDMTLKLIASVFGRAAANLANNGEWATNPGATEMAMRLIEATLEDMMIGQYPIEFYGDINGVPVKISNIPVILKFVEDVYKRQVGTYDITATYTENPNYVLTVEKGTYTITAKEVTVSQDGEYRYNGSPQTVELKLTGVIGDDDVAASAEAVTDAGTHDLTASLSGADAGNYTLANEGAVSVTIDQAQVTVTIDNKESDRLDTIADLTSTVTSGTIFGDDDLGITLNTEANKDVAGTYAITGTSTNTNYDVTFVNGTYTVKALQ